MRLSWKDLHVIKIRGGRKRSEGAFPNSEIRRGRVALATHFIKPGGDVSAGFPYLHGVRYSGRPMNHRKPTLRRRSNGPQKQPAFEQFEASSLFCPRCRQAVPVRKRLLLVLPDGDKYEYLCAHCSTSLGTKMEYEERDIQILV